eukprot:3914625-Amphidinium_carterae.1
MECRKTKERAPGPGPIRKKEWGEIAEKTLHPLTEPIVMHTDSAKAYNLKIQNVHHTPVIHQKKTINGVWYHPCVVRKVRMTIAKKNRVFMAGTQTVDGLWQAIREECEARVSGHPDHIERFVRLAQFKYWSSGINSMEALGPSVTAVMA